MIPVGFGYGEQSMSDPFQPFVSRAPNGFAGGVGNPMQDAFQRFLSAQGQGGVGTPLIRPMSDPFKMFDDGPMTQPTMGRDPFRRSDEGIPLWMQLGRDTGMPPVGQPSGGQTYRRSDEGIPLWMQLGRDTGMPPVGIAGGVGTPAMGDYSMYAPEYRPGGQYGPTPPNRPMSDPFKPQISGGPVGQPMSDPFKPQISGGPVGMAGGGTGTPPIGQPTTQPPAGGLSYNDGFYNPPNRTQQPMAMKTGGLAVKPVWDRKRPKDLGKPKDLSAKKEKSAKARAKAAGRPYPNLIDNMAVARKKGK